MKTIAMLALLFSINAVAADDIDTKGLETEMPPEKTVQPTTTSEETRKAPGYLIMWKANDYKKPAGHPNVIAMTDLPVFRVANHSKKVTIPLLP